MTDPREALARLVRRLDAKSAEDQERLGRYWDRGLADGDVQEDVYRRTDAILAEFDVTPRDESEQPGCTGAGDCPATAHTHGCHADTEGHCEHPEEHGWTPPGERVKPSEEDAARAILMVTQAADADPDYAWNVQYPEVQDELLDQARAVLALLPGRTETEVKAEALREAADDLSARLNGPELIAAADRWGGHYHGVRTAMQNEEFALRARADTIEKEARDEH